MSGRIAHVNSVSCIDDVHMSESPSVCVYFCQLFGICLNNTRTKCGIHFKLHTHALIDKA